DRGADRFVPHTFLNQYFGENNVVWFLQEDALGSIYFISRDYIGLLRKNAAGEYLRDTNTFGKLRKYLNDDSQSISVLNNKQVLDAAQDGFILYDPFLSTPQKTTFHTWIRQVSNDTTIFAGTYTRGDSVVHQQGNDQQPVFPYAS